MNALVIDDDAVVRMLATKMLEAKGYTVTSLKSEEEVITYVSETPLPETTLVLLDLQIGSCTGKQMFDHLRGKFEPFPSVVFISSNTENEAKELDLMNDEGSAYLQKPFQPSSLYALLEELNLLKT